MKKRPCCEFKDATERPCAKFVRGGTKFCVAYGGGPRCECKDATGTSCAKSALGDTEDGNAEAPDPRSEWCSRGTSTSSHFWAVDHGRPNSPPCIE